MNIFQVYCKKMHLQTLICFVSQYVVWNNIVCLRIYIYVNKYAYCTYFKMRIYMYICAWELRNLFAHIFIHTQIIIYHVIATKQLLHVHAVMLFTRDVLVIYLEAIKKQLHLRFTQFKCTLQKCTFTQYRTIHIVLVYIFIIIYIFHCTYAFPCIQWSWELDHCSSLDLLSTWGFRFHMCKFNMSSIYLCKCIFAFVNRC